MINNIAIYYIKNKINDKIYIGLSKDYKNRFRTHKYYLKHNTHKNRFLQFAWNKYGEENFEFDVLEFCSENELSQKEEFWIKFYNSTESDCGYNLTTGGEQGYKFTDGVDLSQSIIDGYINRGYLFFSNLDKNTNIKVYEKEILNINKLENKSSMIVMYNLLLLFKYNNNKPIYVTKKELISMGKLTYNTYSTRIIKELVDVGFINVLEKDLYLVKIIIEDSNDAFNSVTFNNDYHTILYKMLNKITWNTGTFRCIECGNKEHRKNNVQKFCTKCSVHRKNSRKR